MFRLKTSTQKPLAISAGVALIAIISSMVFAHGTDHPTRHVAATGVDQGDCSDSHNPCKSLTYAVELSSKGDTVKIAAGEYQSGGMDIFYLISGLVEIEAGYTTEDHFSQRNIKQNKTVFYGVPPKYREKVQGMGFQAVRDRKAEDIKLTEYELKMLGIYETLNTKRQPFTACENGFAGEFECNRIDLMSRLPNVEIHQESPSLNDIWGFVDLNDNNEYALVGLQNGTAVINVTDAENPVVVGHVPGNFSTWRDLKAYQYFDSNLNEYRAYAYVTTEAAQGMQVIDLTDLPNSVSLANTINDATSAHNIYIANVDYATGVALPGMQAYIYVAGAQAGAGAFRVYDLVNPEQPSLVTAAPNGTGYVHDLTTMVIDDARTAQCANNHNPCEILIDFNENSVDLWDMTDKANPFMISSTGYANVGYTHSGWYSDDKQFIFIQDELDEGNTGANTLLRTLDISDLTAPFVSNNHMGPTTAIDHNGFTRGNRYYMSNYRRGLVVLDVTNPNQPTEVGFFDTYPTPAANTPSFSGAWGTYPYLPSGNVLISDTTYGLFIVKDQAVSSAGLVGFNTTNEALEEDEGAILIEVSRTQGSTGALSVDFATVDDTAVAGADYEAVSGTLEWADGDSSSRTISVDIIDDDVEEENERFSIVLSNYSNTEAEGTVEVTITINRNDQPQNTQPPASGGSSGGGSSSWYLLSLLALGLLARRKF